MRDQHNKNDKLWLGLVVGFIVPVLGYFLVTGVFEILENNNIMDAVTSGSSGRRERTVHLLAICCNILPFNYFNNMRMDQCVKGVVFPTVAFVVAWIFRYHEIIF